MPELKTHDVKIKNNVNENLNILKIDNEKKQINKTGIKNKTDIENGGKKKLTLIINS